MQIYLSFKIVALPVFFSGSATKRINLKIQICLQHYSNYHFCVSTSALFVCFLFHLCVYALHVLFAVCIKCVCLDVGV